MDLKEFKYILEISKRGTVTRAAEALGITQPSLSKYLKKIEDEHNVTLFKRTGKKLILTYAGERYVNKAKEILKLAEEFEADLLNENKDANSKKTLGLLYPSEEEDWLILETLPSFNEMYPQIAIEAKASTENIEQRLVAGEADIAVTHCVIDNRSIDQEELFEEDIILVTTAKNIKIREKDFNFEIDSPEIDFQNLNSKKFILVTSDEQIKIKIVELMKKKSIKPDFLITTSNISSARSLLTRGDWSCLTPRSHSRPLNNDGFFLFFSLGAPELRLKIFFSNRFNSGFSNEIIHLKKLIKSLYRELSGGGKKSR